MTVSNLYVALLWPCHTTLQYITTTPDFEIYMQGFKQHKGKMCARENFKEDWQKFQNWRKSRFSPAYKAHECPESRAGHEHALKRQKKGMLEGVEASSPSTLPLNCGRLPSSLSISAEPDIESGLKLAIYFNLQT